MTTPIYSPEQLEIYLKRISFPVSKYPQLKPSETRTKAGLDYLSLLQKYHLTSVPFENLSLHYSQTKQLSLDSDDLYEKIVVKRRGGYCMENNQFFGNVLRTLGFEVVSTGGRVFHGEAPNTYMTGWGHEINLVIIEGLAYLVDVGFGGPGPTQPIPLIPENVVQYGSTKASHRLILEKPNNPITQPLYVLQHRISSAEEHPWRNIYGFTLTEFIAADYEVMNLNTSTSKKLFFTYMIVCSKMIKDENDDVVGIVALEGGKLKRRVHEDTQEIMVCKTEKERLEALKEYFGIEFSEKEKKGILKTVTALAN